MKSKIDKGQYLSFLDQIDDSPKKTMNLNDRVLIIDGLNTFIRAHSVNPSLNDDGMHVGALIGFLKSLRFTIEKIQPSRVVIVLFGGKKIPELAKGLGKGINEFKKAKNQIKDEIDLDSNSKEESN